MNRWAAVAEMQTPSHIARATALSVSVVVPVFNERHLVATSLRRVFALRHPLISSLEVIVVDDCSTDGSGPVLERLKTEFPNMILLRHEKNAGKGAALRTALPHVTGDVVMLHDA